MKPILLLLLLGAAVTARAQSFSITSSVVGAGGTIGGGGFTVTSTVGEPVSSPMSGGSFAIATGFWSVVGAIAMPDAPTLIIEPHPDGSILVSWPASANGFALERSRDLLPGGWAATFEPITEDGHWKRIRLPVTAGTWFFRLKR